MLTAPFRYRFLCALAALCVGAFGLALPAPAQTIQQRLQDAEASLSFLQQRQGELTNLIAELRLSLTGYDQNIASLQASIMVSNTAIELIADDLERAVDARRKPQSNRKQIAIASFRKGITQQNSLVSEIHFLDANTTEARRIKYHEAVIDASTQELAEIDARLALLSAELADARQQYAGQQSDLEGLFTAQSNVIADLAARETELQETIAAIANTNIAIAGILASQPKSLLTGVDVDFEVARPALAVKIDNTSPARPQAGINSADIVFVEEVEGRLTRLAAVFHSQSPGEIGPVRSMRTSDIGLLEQFNSPLFANSGGNRGTRAALARSSLVDIGVSAASSFYYRTSNRRAPHNLFTNTDNLWAAGVELGGAGLPSAVLGFRGEGDAINPNAVPASSARINYGNASVDYQWNGSGWARSQDGGRTVDTAGRQASPATVVVQFTRYGRSAADSRSPEAISVGSGEAWVFTDGHVVKGTWSRPTAADTTQYLDGNGQEILVLPGQIWIELPRADGASHS